MMFWLAEYNDGTALAQYDPESGKENKFSQIDQSKLTKISWYPATKVLANKVSEIAINPLMTPVSLIVPPGKRARLFRRNRLNYSLSGSKEPRQTVEEYVIGFEGEKLAAHIKQDGSIELREEQ